MVESESFQRHVAKKLYAQHIVGAGYIKGEGMQPNFIQVNGIDISRVNIVGIVVQKEVFDNYGALVVDDGSGSVAGRFFENLEMADDIQLGDGVMIIGRPREYNGEKYILIETLKKVDPKWLQVRKLELGEVGEIPKPQITSAPEEVQNESGIVEESAVIEEDSVVGETKPEAKEVETPVTNGVPKTDNILQLIKEMDSGDGVLLDDLASKNIPKFDDVVATLLQEGDIFEVKPGKVKVLE